MSIKFDEKAVMKELEKSSIRRECERYTMRL